MVDSLACFAKNNFDGRYVRYVIVVNPCSEIILTMRDTSSKAVGSVGLIFEHICSLRVIE